jgi:serine/threonine-protein kinase
MAAPAAAAAAAAAASAAAAPPVPSGPGPAVLRPAFGAGDTKRPPHDDRPSAPQQHLNGGGAPPGQQPPVPNRSGSGPARSHKAQNNRVIIVAGAVALFGATAYAWSLVGADSKDASSASPEPSVLAATGKCVVSYTVWSDDGGKFKASVTVANRDTKAINDWKLWFLMPGDQTMSGNGKEKLDQSDRGVTVTSNAALDSQKSKTMEVTGRYKESNAAPMVFQLDGQTCETYVSGKPGAPSQPVEHLTDGTTRLGPVPTSSTPAPGITILPNGVAVPVPVVSKSTTPTAGPSASVSTSPSASPEPSSSSSKTEGPAPSLAASDVPGTTAPTTTPPTTTDPAPPPPIIDTDPADPVA